MQFSTFCVFNLFAVNKVVFINVFNCYFIYIFHGAA